MLYCDNNRLRKASVAVVGANALSAELTKDIVLCGVGRLVLLDPEQSMVKQSDLVVNFLCTVEDIDEKVATHRCSFIQ